MGSNELTSSRRIAPAPYLPAPPASTAGVPRWRGPALPLLVLALLAVCAFGLLFQLPRWAPPPPAASPPAPLAAATAPAAKPVTPPDEPHIARKLAQQLLQATLARVTALEQAQAGSWSRAEFAQLQGSIATGEKAYREQRFRAAQDAYRAALVEAAVIESRRTVVLDERLAAGQRALASGDSAAAAAAFREALAIDPDQRAATRGVARAASLDRVRALVEQAEAYEQRGEFEQARSAYRAALDLDSEDASAGAGLARLSRAAREAQLRSTIAAGYTALARHDFEAARAAFRHALELAPGAPAVLAAQGETERRTIAAAIENDLAAAARAVQAEAWSEAARAYGAALALDHELANAADGKREAEQRARLSAELESLAGDPLALVTAGAADAAARVLAVGHAVAAGGPRLRTQLAALERALQLAHTAVGVTLQSDGVTAVSVDGVGALGHFARRTLALLPGRYRATCRRDGQRDVRIEFEVAPGASETEITVKCEP